MIKLYRLKIANKVYEVELEDVSEKEGSILQTATTVKTETKVEAPKVEAPTQKTSGEAVNAPMQGVVLSLTVKVGDKVKAGDELLILEAMKMENPIVAPIEGTVESINVSKGENVEDGHLLVTIS